MSEQTKIEWATHTFNPWEGCTKVSPGCANCYAEARNHRFGLDNWGKGKPRRRTSPGTWRNPVKWNANMAELLEDADTRHFVGQGILTVERPRVFPSLCDWLDDEVPIEWLADFLKLIHDTPNLDWLLLTKRPENWRKRIEAVHLGCTPMTEFSFWLCSWLGSRHPLVGRMPEAPANVWIGTSMEDQQRADERIPQLLKIPARVRYLSVEPLLGAVNVAPYLLSDYDKRCFDSQLIVAHDTKTDNKVNWVIVGGESGPGARPCNVSWIRDIVADCNSYGCPCFVKQLGSHVVAETSFGWPAAHWGSTPHGYSRALLKHPKGGDPAEWPEDLRVREFPEVMRCA